MSSFLGRTLSNCYIDIQSRLDVENVLKDMVSVVEIYSLEENLLHIQNQLVESHNLANTLKVEADSLRKEKSDCDSEFDRIRSEAISVREHLVHDIASVVSESRQIKKYQARIRELEARESELIHFVKYGGGREINSVIIPKNDTINMPSTDSYSPAQYEFADSIVEGISDVLKVNTTPIQLVAPRKCPKLLKDLENKLLLLYVSFLDVSEVLIIAQINRQLFARLDQLFQNGSTIPKAAWLISLPDSIVVAAAASDVVAKNLATDSLNNDGSSDNVPAVADKASNDVSTPVGAAAAAGAKMPTGEGRYFGKFSMLLAAADNLLPNAITSGVMNAVGVSRNNVTASPTNSSLHSSSNGNSKTHLHPSNGTSGSIQAGVYSHSPAPSSSGGLTREIAESLSKKLTAAEMKAIINMDDLLKKNTIKLEVTAADNEDLTSKLQGMLTMRDFLIEKLRGAEIALKASMTEATALKGQADADQEIINYLDLRSQELEGKNGDLSLKSEQLQAAYNLQCGSYSHRENQLFVELAEYKSKYEDLEKNYSSHKKILVKEVKHLRNQVGSMAAEKNKYISQLLMVKDVLNSESNRTA